MNSKQKGDLLVQGVGALIIFMIIYNYWLYMVGAALIWFLLREYNRNQNKF